MHAEFSLPLTVEAGGIGTLDRAVTGRACSVTNTWPMRWLRRTSPGMPCCTSRTEQGALAWRSCWSTAGTDRLVIHQATGMIAAQLDDTIANALARLRAAAFASERPMYRT